MKHEMTNVIAGLVSTLTNVALSLHGPAAIVTFRKAAKKVVLQRLLIVRGRGLQPRIVERNSAVLRALLPQTDQATAKVRTILLSLANGDWEDSRHIYH